MFEFYLAIEYNKNIQGELLSDVHRSARIKIEEIVNEYTHCSSCKLILLDESSYLQCDANFRKLTVSDTAAAGNFQRILRVLVTNCSSSELFSTFSSKKKLDKSKLLYSLSILLATIADNLQQSKRYSDMFRQQAESTLQEVSPTWLFLKTLTFFNVTELSTVIIDSYCCRELFLPESTLAKITEWNYKRECKNRNTLATRNSFEYSDASRVSSSGAFSSCKLVRLLKKSNTSDLIKDWKKVDKLNFTLLRNNLITADKKINLNIKERKVKPDSKEKKVIFSNANNENTFTSKEKIDISNCNSPLNKPISEKNLNISFIEELNINKKVGDIECELLLEVYGDIEDFATPYYIYSTHPLKYSQLLKGNLETVADIDYKVNTFINLSKDVNKALGSEVASFILITSDSKYSVVEDSYKKKYVRKGDELIEIPIIKKRVVILNKEKKVDPKNLAIDSTTKYSSDLYNNHCKYLSIRLLFTCNTIERVTGELHKEGSKYSLLFPILRHYFPNAYFANIDFVGQPAVVSKNMVNSCYENEIFQKYGYRLNNSEVDNEDFINYLFYCKWRLSSRMNFIANSGSLMNYYYNNLWLIKCKFNQLATTYNSFKEAFPNIIILSVENCLKLAF